ncbi:TetR/AcrR family transcriptional regulator [Brachybacterium fresconis]|uniref:AcrR family transcriptional regulator n=1 Tax=Brachybacterium fresconis TaxID=173363 RepID=A0ABS4YL30_9MICO|nr:TetR/AcrR family transcriptional regulator [Brachybacterium fresconis]MBP2409507.1 AcrR family transcriptional regulator [Brachybacterium fresconis]
MGTTSTMSPRIERILQVSRELALQGGMRGITIADIAHHAGVGKGTLYLYWSTKEDLFADLLAHDFLDVLSEIGAAMRDNPANVVPHRLLPLVGSTFEQHPFAATVRSTGPSVRSVMENHPAIVQITRIIGPVAILLRIFPVLRHHGVIRADLPLEMQVHAAAGLMHGLHDIASREPVADLLPGSDPQITLATACTALLEPAVAVNPEAAAREARAALDDACTAAIASLHEHDLGKTVSP